jgi:hypothetical protein
MPMSPELRAACDATPKVPLTYITTNSAKHAEHLKHCLAAGGGGVEALLMQEQVDTCGVDFG